jgi:site-specific recombinase XerD
MVRGFAAWLSAYDPRTEVPPKRLLQACHRRNEPHIFTDQVIERLMMEAAKLNSPKGLRGLTHVTLIGLLSSTGLRPGEALALDLPDVNLNNGILAIRQTKFGKSRFVPVKESICTALVRYAERRNTVCPHRPTDGFFVSESGTRLHACAARRTFAKVSRAIGLRAALESRRIGRGPRL